MHKVVGVDRRPNHWRTRDASIFRLRRGLDPVYGWYAFAGRGDATGVVVPHFHAATHGKAKFNEEDPLDAFQGEQRAEAAAMASVLSLEEAEESAIAVYVLHRVLMKGLPEAALVHAGEEVKHMLLGWMANWGRAHCRRAGAIVLR